MRGTVRAIDEVRREVDVTVGQDNMQKAQKHESVRYQSKHKRHSISDGVFLHHVSSL